MGTAKRMNGWLDIMDTQVNRLARMTEDERSKNIEPKPIALC